MELISVVVPVYNVEKYLTRCLDSLIRQTYLSLEIILVDDGSIDASGDICDLYKRNDTRISVIHKENGGLSDARNAGISIAHGKYITFVDSDDFVSDDYVESLFLLIRQHNAEISVCALCNFNENGKIKARESSNAQTIDFSGNEAVIDLCYQKHISNSACAKMYRLDLFDGIQYPKGCLYEDLGTTYKLLLKATRVVYSPMQKYYYFQRIDSIMHYEFSLRNMDRIQMSETLYKDVHQISRTFYLASVSRLFISCIQVLREFPYNDIRFCQEKDKIWTYIKRYRKTVVLDNNAKLINRLIALSSYLGIRVLIKLGKLYTYLQN